MYNILICDDDVVLLDYMKKLANSYFQNTNHQYKINAFSDGSSLVEYVARLFNDDSVILFMDIKLQTESGIGIAQTLQKLYPTIQIIFVTGYIDFAPDMFVVNPVSMLIKPIDPHRFNDSLTKATTMLEQQPPTMVSLTQIVDHHRQIHCRNVLNILYVESTGRKLSVYEAEETFIVNEKIEMLLKRLPNYFIFCHKSYLVNIHYIRTIEQRFIYLIDGTQIPISQSKYSNTIQMFFDFIGDAI